VRVPTGPGRRRSLGNAFGVLAALAVLTSTACGSAQTGGGSSTTTEPEASTAATRSPSAPGATRGLPPHRRHVSVTVEPWRLPRPVAREAVVRTAGGVVVAGGLVVGDVSTAATYRLDLRTGRVRPMPDLPVPVHDVAGGLDRGRPFVVGGGGSTEQDAAQSWRPGVGWAVSGRLPTPRSDLVCVTVNRRAVVIGGYDGTTPALPEILVSRGGHRWWVLGRLRVPVRYAAAAVADGAIWVFGGERSGAMVDAVQRVNVRSGRVRVVARLPHPLGHAAAVPVGRRILLIGGRTSGARVTDRMWWFEPGHRDFRVAGRLRTPLADAAVVATGRAAYLVGGETPLLSDRVFRISVR
jgi:N-acetylneuraminic acid mutarotase